MSIEIGVLMPRSNSYPLLGQHILRGLKLAFARHEINIQVTVENIERGENSDNVLNKANSLVMNDVELCFAIVGTNSIAPLNNLFSQSGIPLILLNAGERINMPQDFQPATSTFIHSLSLWQSMLLLGKYAAQQYKRIVSTSSFFESGYQFLNSFSRNFLQESKNEFAGIHSTQQFLEEDFKVNLKNIIEKENPEAVLALYSGMEAAEFNEKCLTKGYTKELPILGLPIGLEKAANQEIIAAATWFEHTGDTENKNFVNSYIEKHKKTPDMFAALAFEAAHTLANAINKNGGWDSETVCNTLKNNKHHSIRGEFSYTETGETTDFPSYIMQGNKELLKNKADNIEEIKNDDREMVSSGWFNPYPCS
jgi:ABC-type branched-subunit amino acid transport system substrate-binding protein